MHKNTEEDISTIKNETGKKSKNKRKLATQSFMYSIFR